MVTEIEQYRLIIAELEDENQRYKQVIEELKNLIVANNQERLLLMEQGSAPYGRIVRLLHRTT